MSLRIMAHCCAYRAIDDCGARLLRLVVAVMAQITLIVARIT